MFKTSYVPPAVVNAAVPVVTTPTGAGQSVGHPSKRRVLPNSDRPFTTLLLLNFPEYGGEAHVTACPKDCPHALRLSRTLRRFVNKAKLVKTLGEAHLLVYSVYRSVSVYVTALVFDRNNSVRATPHFPLGLFQCIDDLFILFMRGSPVNKSNFHDQSLSYLLRLVNVSGRYFASLARA